MAESAFLDYPLLIAAALAAVFLKQNGDSDMRLNQLFLLLIALGLTVPALAADRPADLADSWIVVVKDGHDEEFETALKGHLKHRAKNKDSRSWKTYAPIVGDDLNHYVIRHCCSTYADMDEYRAWSEKNKMNGHWNENVDPHVADYRHYFVRIDHANNNWPEEDPGFELYGVTSWDEKSGHQAAIAQSKAALSNAAKDGGWQRYWSWSDPVGGDGGLMLVTPYMNYADMEGPEGGFSAFLAKQVGEKEAAEILSGFSSNFDGSTYTLYRKVDDLSMKD